jgi:ferredoxin-NADP reductase
MSRNDCVTTVVKSIRTTAPDVHVYELVQPEDWELPSFDAGAHVDVHIPGGLVRQYSLAGDPAEQRSYTVAVMADRNGRGGSEAFCAETKVGTEVHVSLPKNYFAMAAGARRHIFIAGGIGITPFLSMMRVALRRGESFELHYCTRTAINTPFRDELEKLGRERIRFHHSQGTAAKRLNIAEVMQRCGPDDHVYCCGPDRLMNAVREEGVRHLDAGNLHFERFAVPEAGAGASPAFEVKLLRQNRSIPVEEGESVLNALRRCGVTVDAGCEAGTCGDCKTRYLEGRVMHLDFRLSEAERGEFMMPCVSRSLSPSLTLDL